MYVYTAEPFEEKVKQHRLHDEAAKLYETLKSLDTYGTLRGLLEPVWPRLKRPNLTHSIEDLGGLFSDWGSRGKENS